MDKKLNPYDPPQTELNEAQNVKSSWLWIAFIFGVPLLTVILVILFFA